MHYEDLNWFDVEQYLRQDDRLMIILGACEQHGYLSLLTDVKIPSVIADAASHQTGVLIAPTINFGSSPYFLSFPGTISLRLSTLLQLVGDIVKSVHSHGFNRILVLNGHGGNEGVRLHLSELANELPGIKLKWYSWWQSHSIQEVAVKYDLKPAHANWLEAFPFTIVGDLPEGEKLPVYVPGVVGSDEARQMYKDGVFGGRYQVDGSIMDELLTAAIEDVLQLLRFD